MWAPLRSCRGMVLAGSVVGLVTRRPAVPVQAEHGGVVAQIAADDPQDGVAERVHDLAGMQVGGVAQRGVDVQIGGVPFEHPVGDEHDAVARFERERLQLDGSAGLEAKRQIDGQLDLLDPALTEPPGAPDGQR